MVMSERRKNALGELERLRSTLEQLKGETIAIYEYLTSNEERAYDRHCTSTSHFMLQVESVGWRISGGRLWIEGVDSNEGKLVHPTMGLKIVNPSAYYEIDCGSLRDIFFGENEITTIEALSDRWIRKTEIRFAR